MTGLADRFGEQLRQAGITPGKPLHAVLMTVMETAERAREAVRGGARGLTPEGEADLIQRVAQAATVATRREAARIVRRSGFATAAMLAMAGLLLVGVGYGLGRWEGARRSRAAVEAVEGAAFLANVAMRNDLRAMAEKCRRTQRREKGGVACDLPPVWVGR